MSHKFANPYEYYLSSVTFCSEKKNPSSEHLRKIPKNIFQYLETRDLAFPNFRAPEKIVVSANLNIGTIGLQTLMQAISTMLISVRKQIILSNI